jgi:serine/threonine-protein kinase
VDDDVARLVREERLVEAAELASARGDAKGASEIFERACAWKRASVEALRAGDAARALVLAVAARDDGDAARALDELATNRAGAERVAWQLERRGDHAWAARAFEAAGRSTEAASAWEHAGEGARAAALYERAGDPARAARALDTAIRREPQRWELHAALGELLLRYGKPDAAVRALQKVPQGTPHRARALASLVVALERIDLTQAAEEAKRELAALPPPPASAEDARASVPSSTAPRMRLFGRYEVVREIASSPTARVVEATDVVRGSRVAVKIFAAHDVRGGGRDALVRFEREVRVLAALAHPSVVPLYDYVADGPALVLAWMAGGTLEQMLATETLAPARAIEIAGAVLGALGDAHRLGVLHRDVKPANVLFDEAGAAKLGDFGVAHLGDLSTTATAGVIGTLAYMSPEQREGRPATIASDLFGVGVILREMLTGEKPSAGEPARVRPSAAHRDLDARHDAVVLRFTDADPAARPSDAFAARRELLALPWPRTVERVATRPAPERAPSERPAARLDVRADGSVVDRWIGRAIERVPLTERSLGRAAAFARTGDRALQAVLRVDRIAEEIWLEPMRGRRLDRPLAAGERSALARALGALHDAGIAHGCVCADHVFVDATGEIALAFVAQHEATATPDRDRVALARLA